MVTMAIWRGRFLGTLSSQDVDAAFKSLKFLHKHAEICKGETPEFLFNLLLHFIKFEMDQNIQLLVIVYIHCIFFYLYLIRKVIMIVTAK